MAYVVNFQNGANEFPFPVDNHTLEDLFDLEIFTNALNLQGDEVAEYQDYDGNWVTLSRDHEFGTNTDVLDVRFSRVSGDKGYSL